MSPIIKKNLFIISLLTSFALGILPACGFAEDEISPETPVAAPSQNSPQQNLGQQNSGGGNFSFGRYLSGKFAESHGDGENGIAFLRESLKNDPDNVNLQLSLYNLLLGAGNIEEAIEIANKLQQQQIESDNPDFPLALLSAVGSAKKGDFKLAASQTEKISKTGFNSLLIPLLQNWLKISDMKTSIEAKDVMPNGKLILSHAYLNAAFINEIAGFKEAADKQYEDALVDTRIENFRAAEALINYYKRSGRKQELQKFTEQYSSQGNRSFLADFPDIDSPEPLVADATQGLAEAFYTIAAIFHGVRSPEDEIASLNIALYLRPDFSAAKFLLAGSYELTNSYAKAINVYKSIDPTSIYYSRGRILTAYDQSELGNKTEAIVALEKIIAESPDDITALLAKGDILRSQNNFKDAIISYNDAEKRLKSPQKRHWIIYFSRGACYDRIGERENAENDMRKALALNPDEPDVLNYLGYSLLEKRQNIAEAKKMIEQAYEQRPEDAHIIDSMGYSLYVEGDFASAKEYFEQALERIADDPTTNEHLGDTYWQLGRKTEARYQWQKAIDRSDDEIIKSELKKKLENGITILKSPPLP